MTLSYIPSDTNDEGILKATASGVLPNGKPVVVNADGTVSVVGPVSISQVIGTPVVFESTSSVDQSAIYDSNAQKVVVAYKNGGNSNYGTAVVGTVSGSSISFGTPVVFEAAASPHISTVYDTNAQKVVIFYRDDGNSSQGTAIVGTVSGTSISFGTPVLFYSGVVSTIRTAYDSNAQKIVVAYRDHDNSSSGRAKVGTVNGTSISFGSHTEFTASVSNTALGYDSSAQKIVFVYRATGVTGSAKVGTVSGTSISFGSATSFSSAGIVGGVSVVYDSNAQKVVIPYVESSRGKAIVGTVSGTSISFGTAVIFSTGNVTYLVGTYHSDAKKVVMAYTDADNSNYGTVIVGTVSGTSISYSSSAVFEAAYAAYSSPVYDSNANKVVISYSDVGASYNLYGTAVVFQPAYTSLNLTSENYIGMSSGSTYADGSNATIKIIGNTANVPERNYALDSASYDNKSFSVASQDTEPHGVYFKSDGLKMYVVGNNNDNIYQYILSTAWDVSTASYDNKSFSTGTQDAAPRDVFLNDDGTKAYVAGGINSTIYEYDLSTAYDISTASYNSVSFSVASQEVLPTGFFFKPDGTKFWICGQVTDAVYQYSLSTSWDLSTASFDSVTFSVATEDTAPQSLFFKSDGTKMYVTGRDGDAVYQYTLSTAWDLSTASYDSVSFDVSSQDGLPTAVFFKDDGTKMYIGGDTNNTIYQYSTEFTLTAGQSHFVQTDGTIGLTADDPSVFAGTAISATRLIIKT